MKMEDCQWSQYLNAPLSQEALALQQAMRPLGFLYATCDQCRATMSYGRGQTIEEREVEHALTGCNGRLR